MLKILYYGLLSMDRDGGRQKLALSVIAHIGTSEDIRGCR